ncbi:MAG: RNB domain-containing ribonuclease [Pseudomonadota bacterium]
MTFQKNDIIDYYDEARLSCALVLEVDDRRLHILNDQGKEANISASRALIGGIEPNFPTEASRDDQIKKLKEISARRDEIKNTINLQELWEIVVTETDKISLMDLSELLFGAQNDLESRAAFVRAIVENRLYFKVKPNVIEVVSPEKVGQEEIRRKKEFERGLFLSKCADFLSTIKSGGETMLSDAPAGLPEMLEEAALIGNDWLTQKKVRDIFSRAGMIPSWDPFKVLVKLGFWSEDENIRLKSEQIALDFSAKAQAQAEVAANKIVDNGYPRETFTENVITIDSESTHDIDDAISIESDRDKIIIGVHITEAAFFVEHDSELDLEIRERAVTIYMPDLVLPMMPPVLSEQSASLVREEFRPCISALAVFDSSMNMTDYRLSRSMIKVGERLTYEEADRRIINGNSSEAKMFEVARSLREKRLNAGAIIFKDPELSIKVDGDGSIDVVVRERESCSQILVSEFMILANYLFAKTLMENKIPSVYRSQPPPLEKIQLGHRHDPVLSYRCKKALARGSLSLYPEPHSTLGLSVYTTATSPLRRYTDLLTQRQLVACLDSRVRPIDADTLDMLLSDISPRLERSSLVERERHRYYLLKYMRQRKNDEFEVIVLHRFPRFYLVQLEALGVNTVLHTPPGVSLNPYDRAVAKVENVNPRADRLTLSLGSVLPII